ncbi:hypothetical protein VDF98_12150 [Xanthomonas campestris pv. raphani]|uniref:hypothetical protein n=1 Tax=Xanthomonas campestris TaxID=339 RepID=UPI002368B221|nr:hypothetical protein [Xanthomonas campestris]MEA9852605.1 hypothetical protein [Xanthomonas campestris pv. raphani]MEA9856688.1 hypothetical protein [Xanthomonas campestris pv. raphani]MEA9904734.1 hypothetical protein [Xanthomonas campestris pv. raphani]MEA9965500.1 hypothetical protein [Xanthomonas campestris pv. raphani]WDJ22559.1 hypothetical protein JH270_00700 [Xanthomonas campestris pv. raphani]
MVMSLIEVVEVVEVVEVMRGVRQRAKALRRWSGGESWSAVHTRGGHSALLKAENSASCSAQAVATSCEDASAPHG